MESCSDDLAEGMVESEDVDVEIINEEYEPNQMMSILSSAAVVT